MGGIVVLLLLLALSTLAIGGVSRLPQAMMLADECDVTPCPCMDRLHGPCQLGERCVPQPAYSKCAFSCVKVPPQDACCQPPKKNGYEADECSHRDNANCKATEACCFDGCRNVCMPKVTPLKH